jgi:hypothetical protein
MAEAFGLVAGSGRILAADAAAPAPAAAPVAPSQAPATPVRKGEAPPIDAWIKDTKGRTGSFIRTLAFVTDLPEKGKGEPKYLPIDAAAFNALSYIQAANQASAAWDYKLNKDAFADVDPLALVVTRSCSCRIKDPGRCCGPTSPTGAPSS